MRVFYAVAFVRVNDCGELGKNPLGGNILNERSVFFRAHKTFLVGGKAKLGGLAGKAHKPKSVFPEYLFRWRNRAQTFVFNIVDSAQRVAKRVRFHVVIDGVGSEIAALGVRFHIVRKIDFDGGMYAANVFVRAKTGVFIFRFFFVEKLHRARVRVDGFYVKAKLLCKLFECFGRQRRANIPIPFFAKGGEICQIIAYAATHHV